MSTSPLSIDRETNEAVCQRFEKLSPSTISRCTRNTSLPNINRIQLFDYFSTMSLQPPLNFILPFDPSHTDGGVEGRGNKHNWKYSDVCSWAKQYVKFERMKRMGSRAQTLNACRLIARVARRRASLMRISSLDSAYEGQPVARQTSEGGLWLLCARRGAITRNCSSCHFPAPGPLPSPLASALLLLIRPAPVASSSLFSALSRSPFLKRSFVGVFIAVYPRILSMGVARTSFKKRRKRRGRGESKAVEQILILF